MHDDEVKELLWPSWAARRNGPGYDELSDTDKAVWRGTRGQRQDADSVIEWLKRLARAVVMGDITQADADAAIKRMGE